MKTLTTAAGTALFPGFTEALVSVPEGEVFVRFGGSGAPLLLLHGYPQTSAIWHRMTGHLTDRFTVICADLRGYGRSSKPASTPDHASYSKRAMAVDLVAMMSALGHERFLVGAHDRGARVAHRLALDHPARVRALAVLDIAPTREMYALADTPFAQTYWHWYWLTQPAPFPERLIGADPRFFWLKKCGSQLAGMAPFHWAALNEYLERFCDPDVIRGSCEDYRAALTIDIAHDDADGDRKVDCPLQALWGANGAIEAHFDALDLWRRRASNVSGKSLPGGHYLAEELPEQVAAEWRPFFDAAPVP
jgi:haloacetate dehalogenase